MDIDFEILKFIITSNLYFESYKAVLVTNYKIINDCECTSITNCYNCVNKKLY